MVFFIEISNPFQPRPWFWSSRVMYRCGWGWFAIAILRISLREFSETPWSWDGEDQGGI